MWLFTTGREGEGIIISWNGKKVERYSFIQRFEGKVGGLQPLGAKFLKIPLLRLDYEFEWLTRSSSINVTLLLGDADAWWHCPPRQAILLLLLDLFTWPLCKKEEEEGWWLWWWNRERKREWLQEQKRETEKKKRRGKLKKNCWKKLRKRTN